MDWATYILAMTLTFVDYKQTSTFIGKNTCRMDSNCELNPFITEANVAKYFAAVGFGLTYIQLSNMDKEKKVELFMFYNGIQAFSVGNNYNLGVRIKI